MKKFGKFLIIILAVVFFTFSIIRFLPVSAALGTKPDLGTAGNFSVLAKTSIGLSGGGSVSLDGNLGISAGDSSSLTGTWNAPNKYFSDTPTPDNLVASKAQADALIAYNNLASQPSSGVWNWGLSRRPPPGVWDMGAGDPYVNSIITLEGDVDDVWIFRFTGDLFLTGSVVMAGNAQPCNVFWIVNNDTSVRVTGDVSYNKSFFNPKIAYASDVYKLKGNLISNGPIEFWGSVNIEGRIISLNGSISTLFMDGVDSFITQPACVAASSVEVLGSGGGQLPAPDLDDVTPFFPPVSPAISTTNSVVDAPVVISPPAPDEKENIIIPKFPKTGFNLFSFFKKLFNFKQDDLTASTIEAVDTSTPENKKNDVPVNIKIPSIKVDANIGSVGVLPDGTMGIPKNFTDVVWFNLGPNPGEIGSAVIDGHSGRKGKAKAVFDNLNKLKKGDKIYVQNENGTNITFVVRESRKYDFTADTKEVFVSNDKKSHLNLITCAGVWNPILGTHSKRLVIFADKEI